MRAFILRSRKMPRPGIFTDSPLFTVLTTVSVSEVRRSSACFRLTPPTSATFATNCDFVISTSWGGRGGTLQQSPCGCQETLRYQALARCTGTPLTPRGSPRGAPGRGLVPKARLAVGEGMQRRKASGPAGAIMHPCHLGWGWRVAFDELDRMTFEIKNVIEALLKMDYELRKVHNLKLAFEARQPGPGGSG